MKFGVRRPSLKKSFSAKTSGNFKRRINRAIVPGYGRKGYGWLKNPKKTNYNRLYNRTTISSKKFNSSLIWTLGVLVFISVIYALLPYLLGVVGIILIVFLILKYKSKNMDQADHITSNKQNENDYFQEKQYLIFNFMFMSENSKFINFSDFKKESGLTWDDLNSIDFEKLNYFVKENTNFTNWEAMYEAAYNTYISNNTNIGG